MRNALGYLLEVTGFACLVIAAYFVSPVLALAVIGVGLIVVAQAARR